MHTDTQKPLSLLEHYRQLVPLTSGRVGSLTPEETSKLHQLWALLFSEFETSDPLPVLFSLAHCKPGQRDQNDEGDVTALSFEPVSSYKMSGTTSSGSNKHNSSSNSNNNNSENAKNGSGDSKSSGGWFGWMGSSSPSSSSNASSGASTPTVAPDKDAELQRTETVQEYLHRTAANKVGETPKASNLVPPDFKPLFGQPPLTRSFRAGFWQAATQIGDPDSWVLRFLRARKWDVNLAFDMIKKTVVWRVAQAIDEVAYFGESMLHYHTMDTGLAFACAEDRLKSPVYIVRVRVNIARNRNILAIKRFLCWQIETSQLLAGKSDGRVTILFDLTGFTKENIDIKLVVTLISLLANYYPETLGILILHVNSWVFTGIWSVISPFIDPVVKSKIVMAKTVKDIEPYIDMDQLICEVGGKKEFDYKYILPSSAENARMADADGRRAAEEEFVKAIDRYGQLTLEWIRDGRAADVEASRQSARDELRAAAVGLDPFVRASTLYSRFGFIKQDKSVSF
ncbi:phosphatidylinositol transfer protein csr1 [Dipsacomyces acuminosporus]|nr:phosphatidylinositol transfer protein csr1 [Dipsacomyces acuminosporus]